MSDLATSPLPLRTPTRPLLHPAQDMTLFHAHPRPPNQRSPLPRTPRNALHALYRPLNDYSPASAACPTMCWISWLSAPCPCLREGEFQSRTCAALTASGVEERPLLSARRRPRRRRGVQTCQMWHVRNSARPSRVNAAAYSWTTTLLPHMNNFQLCSTATTEIRTGLLDQTLDFLREPTASTTHVQCDISSHRAPWQRAS